MYIKVETSDGGNKDTLSSLTKEIKYHHPDEILLITR